MCYLIAKVLDVVREGWEEKEKRKRREKEEGLAHSSHTQGHSFKNQFSLIKLCPLEWIEILFISYAVKLDNDKTNIKQIVTKYLLDNDNTAYLDNDNSNVYISNPNKIPVR